MIDKLVKNAAVTLSCVLCLTAWSVRLSPTQIGMASFAWFAFPYVAIGVMAATVLSIIGRHVIASLATIASLAYAWPQIGTVLSFSDSQKEIRSGEGIKLLTYNVHAFTMPLKKNDKKAMQKEAVGYIRTLSPDIICMQEAPDKTVLKHLDSAISEFLNSYPYMLTDTQKETGRQTILSRYPLTEVQPDTYLPRVLIADVKTPQGTIRIFNCHLASYQLSPKQIDTITDGHADRTTVSSLLHTLSQMKTTMCKRATEAENLSRNIANSDVPTLTCGDFNDTPISYTYNTIAQSRKSHDAFVGSGTGFGNTFLSRLPRIRIDYVLTAEGIRTAEYKEHDVDYSDHKPVSVMLKID